MLFINAEDRIVVLIAVFIILYGPLLDAVRGCIQINLIMPSGPGSVVITASSTAFKLPGITVTKVGQKRGIRRKLCVIASEAAVSPIRHCTIKQTNSDVLFRQRMQFKNRPNAKAVQGIHLKYGFPSAWRRSGIIVPSSTDGR